MFIDSHCHIDTIDLNVEHQGQIEVLMQEIADAKVIHMLCVSIDLDTLPNIQKLAANYSHISYSVGVHPNVILDNEPSDNELIKIAQAPKCIAIGETGLDYYRNSGDMRWQHERFSQHINVANQLQMPLIVHTRDAASDTVAQLQNESNTGVIMHCFAEDWTIASKCLDLGYYISLSGIVSFKNAHQVHEVAKKIPLDRLLIETDSPYLAPMPYRGKTNRPSWVSYVAKAIADLRGLKTEYIAQVTTNNFLNLFPTVNI